MFISNYSMSGPSTNVIELMQRTVDHHYPLTNSSIPIAQDVAASIQTNYMAFGCFTMLVWDHIITFSDEVEYIWKRKKGPLVYLFLLNRYMTPLGFIVNLFAFLSPIWTPERCAHFIRYEGCMTAISVEIVGVMMLIRVRALYHRRPWIVYPLVVILLVETGVNAWLLTYGEAVAHNPKSGTHSCRMIFDPSISTAASASAWIPLLYDTIVLGLTLYRTIPPIKNRQASYIVKRLLEDGLLYYSAIFSVTLVLTVMILAAPPDIKNITAQLELMLTVTMMSRITLSLRESARNIQGLEDILPKSSNVKSSLVFKAMPLSTDTHVQVVERTDFESHEMKTRRASSH